METCKRETLLDEALNPQTLSLENELIDRGFDDNFKILQTGCIEAGNNPTLGSTFRCVLSINHRRNPLRQDPELGEKRLRVRVASTPRHDFLARRPPPLFP